MSFFLKKKDSKLDYPFLWKPWLKPQTTGRYISSSTTAISGPDDFLEKSGESFDNYMTSVTIAGGTVGETYKIINTIETNDGLIESDEIEVKIT